MKNRFEHVSALILCLVLGWVSAALGQEPTTQGFLNIVNLVPGDKNLTISLTGKDVVPGGLKSADSTGWFIVPTGNLSLGLEVEGYAKASGSIDIAEMQSVVYVMFLEANPQKDKDGKPLPPKLRAKRCEVFDAPNGYALKMVSFCPGENRFVIGPNNIDLKLYASAEVPKWNGGAFQVMLGKNVVGETTLQPEKAPFYVFVGTDHAGKYSTCLVRAEKQDLPPWMKKKTQNP